MLFLRPERCIAQQSGYTYFPNGTAQYSNYDVASARCYYYYYHTGLGPRTHMQARSSHPLAA
jgi:hypothetical protein